MVVVLADLLVAVEARVEARVVTVQPLVAQEDRPEMRVQMVLMEQIVQAVVVVVAALVVAAADITAVAGKHL